jgi:hypothetical protein
MMCTCCIENEDFVYCIPVFGRSIGRHWLRQFPKFNEPKAVSLRQWCFFFCTWGLTQLHWLEIACLIEYRSALLNHFEFERCGRIAWLLLGDLWFWCNWISKWAEFLSGLNLGWYNPKYWPLKLHHWFEFLIKHSLMLLIELISQGKANSGVSWVSNLDNILDQTLLV